MMVYIPSFPMMGQAHLSPLKHGPLISTEAHLSSFSNYGPKHHHTASQCYDQNIAQTQFITWRISDCFGR